MKTQNTAALELIEKSVQAIQTVQAHLIENYDDNLAALALDSAISEIEGVSAIIGFDFKGFEVLPEPIKARITKLRQPTISESLLSEFFEWLEATGEWTCDSTIFDSAWQRFKVGNL